MMSPETTKESDIVIMTRPTIPERPRPVEIGRPRIRLPDTSDSTLFGGWGIRL